jgi:Arc/MetJ-type ribon-helix-helix transcriptional regulator
MLRAVFRLDDESLHGEPMSNRRPSPGSVNLTRVPLGAGASPRYDSGMTTKIAVSLPDHLVEAARAAVRDGRAASVSAVVADALRSYLRVNSLQSFLDELDAEFGPPSTEDLAWADSVLGLG